MITTNNIQIGARKPSAWSARCDCRNDHNSSSGRCNTRNCGTPGGYGVTDPTRVDGEVAICASCRVNCPVGAGSQKDLAREAATE